MILTITIGIILFLIAVSLIGMVLNVLFSVIGFVLKVAVEGLAKTFAFIMFVLFILVAAGLL